MQMRIEEMTSDFQTVFATIQPLSYYGKIEHRAFEMFQRGDEMQLVAYLQQVENARSWLVNRSLRSKVERLLRKISNIDGYLDQAGMGSADDVSIFHLNRTTNILADLYSILQNIPEANLSPRWESIKAVQSILKDGNQYGEGFFLADSYNKELARLRTILREVERRYQRELRAYLAPISEFLDRDLTEHFTISTQQQDLQAFLATQPQVEIDFKNNSATGYRLVFSQKLRELKAQKHLLESDLATCLESTRLELVKQLQVYLEDYPRILDEMGTIDVLLARSKVANRFSCVMPEITRDDVFEMVGARHILLEKKLKARKKTFTPRSLHLKLGSALMTGINMGGKTVTLRTIALLASMAQAGMPVPAQSLKLRLSDFIYFNDQEKDTVLTGLSHFGQEIRGLEAVLKQCLEHGLVLVDEILHGTAPVEGEALATAYLERLHQSNCLCLASTHYPGIVEELDVPKWRIKGIDHEALERDYAAIYGGIKLAALSDYIDYRVVEDTGSQRSETFTIAHLLGVDSELIHQAKKIANQINKQHRGGSN